MKSCTSLIGMAIAMLVVLSTMTPAFASISPATLEATLAPGESVTETKTVSIPSLPPKADVVFAFDLTGSMGSTIETAKARSIDIMNNLSATGVDINYGVISYMDYPNTYDSYGYYAQYGSSSSGDYAYALNQTVTSDTTAVSNAINGLNLGWGADGPQDYTRIFYESYASSSVGWRPGAKKILVNFGDNVPHDDNLSEGITSGTWSTGGDPGRDEIMFTADDLDLQTVLADMATNNVILLEAHTADWPVEYMGGPAGFYLIDYWNYWTGITGGRTFITYSPTLVDDVVNNVTSVLTAPTISDLHLQASPGYESWLVSVTPASYSGPTGVSVNFDLVIKVPEGTSAGTYTFTISAVDDSGVSYGDQTVTITVPEAGGNVTGGGSIASPAVSSPKKNGNGPSNNIATFGFVAHYADGATIPSGNLQYTDHPNGMKVHGNVTTLSIDKTTMTATFSGIAKVDGVDGYAYTVTVVDNGEPGKTDTFAISIPAKSYAANGILGGGNIQIHDP